MKRGSGCCAVDIYCTTALTSFSDSVSYMTSLFSEWRIVPPKYFMKIKFMNKIIDAINLPAIKIIRGKNSSLLQILKSSIDDSAKKGG